MSISAQKLLEFIKVNSIRPEIFKTLISTNLTAKERGLSGEAEGALIIAESQTGGRGRLGRRFFSEPGGAYFSLLLTPDLSPNDITLITPLAAVSVCEAILSLTEKRPKIKWVNDILVDDKKVAGILTETVFCGQKPITVLGIGVNLFNPQGGFPEEIKDIAGTLFEEDKKITEKFIAETVNKFYEYYSALPFGKFLEKYKSLSMIIGQEITYFKEDKPFSGMVLDIDNRCRLVVKDKSGETKILSSGEVTIGSKKIIEMGRG